MAGKQHNITVNVNDVLYYVDYDLMNVYVNKNDQFDIKVGKDPVALQNPDTYVFDESLTQPRFDNFKAKFLDEMQKRYKSLKPVDKTIKGVHYLLQSDMFIVAFEDNNWSVGVELLHNPKCKNENLRKSLFPTFAKGMRNILLDIVGEIHTRTGSWSTNIIDKTKAKEMDDAEKAAATAAKQNTDDSQTNDNVTTTSDDTQATTES